MTRWKIRNSESWQHHRTRAITTALSALQVVSRGPSWYDCFAANRGSICSFGHGGAVKTQRRSATVHLQRVSKLAETVQRQLNLAVAVTVHTRRVSQGLIHHTWGRTNRVVAIYLLRRMQLNVPLHKKKWVWSCVSVRRAGYNSWARWNSRRVAPLLISTKP